jgi:tetratricopeptide (TPR) repeat protein
MSRRPINRTDKPVPSGDAPTREGAALGKGRYALFLTVTLLVPVLFLLGIEAGLRVAKPAGLSVFIHAPAVGGDYLVANRLVGERWFSGIDNPPTPAHEFFARVKPAHAFRVFVMGESAAAGFPYPHNVEFSRLLGDVLRDVLPGDSVEVINLAIAATNSFSILDMANEVAAQRPDAVLIYAGHNEYYGALGAASRVSVPGGVTTVHLYLRALRLRSVLALRNGLARVASWGKTRKGDLEAASLMEILARDRQIPLGGSRYDDGVRQFESNLSAICELFRQKKIAVLVGSLASNLRDQPPFAADANAAPGGADSVFAAAQAAFASGDSLRADSLYIRARDLDVVRFRAPSEFNAVIRRVTARTGSIYVPVAEAFAAASPGGAPGSNIFLEHVHPTRKGQALIGRVFFESLIRSGILGSRLDTTRLRPWNEYASDMSLTPLDERIAFHTTRTLLSRWPFVPISRQVDYRGNYVPTSLLDSLAFAVSAGEQWELAKLRLGADYERRAYFDSAAAEYAGLARDAPLSSEPLLLAARALGRAGKTAAAESTLARAVAIRPTPAALNLLATRAAQRHDLPRAASYFEKSLAIAPAQPETLYQLALVYAMSQKIDAAKETAVRLSRVAPGYPKLPGLLKALRSGQ